MTKDLTDKLSDVKRYEKAGAAREFLEQSPHQSLLLFNSFYLDLVGGNEDAAEGMEEAAREGYLEKGVKLYSGKYDKAFDSVTFYDLFAHYAGAEWKKELEPEEVERIEGKVSIGKDIRYKIAKSRASIAKTMKQQNEAGIGKYTPKEITEREKEDKKYATALQILDTLQKMKFQELAMSVMPSLEKQRKDYFKGLGKEEK